ncbi:MAG: CmcJ/NvfI family oxidoreductase [Pseudomonadota bacterium]
MQETAIVNYHIKSTEAQAFIFDADGIVGNLVSPELAPTKVNVRNLRDAPSSVTFNSNGITFEKYQSIVESFTENAGWQDVYDQELSQLLMSKIGADEVIIFDHTIRIDSQSANRKPARNVHNDYSKDGAENRLVDLLGEERAAEFRNGHFGFVNVWRPIEHTIRTSPLGFIHPASVREEDWMPIQLIYPDRMGQILGVAHNAEHDWFYLSGMQPEEVAIFNIYDNRGLPHLAHSALDIESSADSNTPRKSIESRTLVRYAH